jgi:hypothetical protein
MIIIIKCFTVNRGAGFVSGEGVMWADGSFAYQVIVWQNLMFGLGHMTTVPLALLLVKENILATRTIVSISIITT